MTVKYTTVESKHFIVTSKCDKTNPKQLWKCERNNKKNYIKLVQSGRYLHNDRKFGKYVTAEPIPWSMAKTWTRYGSKQDVCSQGNLHFTNKI